MAAQALVLRRDHGGTVTLAEPIPVCSVATLGMLLAATAREWVIVHGHNGLEIAGHRFVPIGWDASEQPAGVVLEHRCTCVAFGQTESLEDA